RSVSSTGGAAHRAACASRPSTGWSLPSTTPGRGPPRTSPASSDPSRPAGRPEEVSAAFRSYSCVHLLFLCREQVPVRRNVREQLGMGTDVGDRAVLKQGHLVGEHDG